MSNQVNSKTNSKIKETKSMPKNVEIVSVKTESRKVTCEGCKIISVSSPSTIQRIAIDKNLNPQEVFVRCTVEFKGTQFTVSNKLRFLTKAGYNELLEAKEKGSLMKLVVDVDKEFFYIEHDVDVDSLFKDSVEPKTERKSLTELIGLC